MSTDDPNAELLTRPFAPGPWDPGPVIPPPPTGPLAPPAPPPLTADIAAGGEAVQGGAHRDESAPPYPGGQLSEGLRIEMVELLNRSGGRLREVFDQFRAGVTSPAALVAAGAASSEANAGDLMVRIRTILGEPWAGAPGRARPVAGTVRALMRAPGLSGEAVHYLAELRSRLLSLVESELAQRQEQALLEANSAVLSRELRTGSGVVVHTYPHYWRHPYLVEPNRRLLWLGKAADGGWQRVLDQSRAAGAPEDPVLLRVYVTTDPAAAERAFRRLLESADHGRATNGGGREWFATTLEFLDEIAGVLGIDIKAGPDPAL